MFKYVCPYAVFKQGLGGGGGGGAHFCDPVIQHFFLLSMNRDVLKNRCML